MAARSYARAGVGPAVGRSKLLAVPRVGARELAGLRAHAWPIAVLLVLGALLRLPFVTTHLSHWDEVQYALALHEFDVLVHQPQPPGSPLYILLGRALLGLIGDEHRTFVVISITTSAAAVVCEYAVACLAFDRRTAMLASAALLTYPAFWGYAANGSAWTTLALLSGLVGLCCVQLLRGRRGVALGSGLLIGLASGFRADVTVFMAPLWLWCLCRAEPRWKQRAVALAAAGLGVAAAVGPVVWATGPTAWLRLLLDLFAVAPGGDGALRHFASNTLVMWAGAAAAAGPLLVGAAVLGWRRGWRPPPVRRYRDMLCFTALWVGPSFVFLWVADATEAGHNLLYLVGLYPAVAAIVVHAVRRARPLLYLGGVVVAAQVAVFLAVSPRVGPPLAYTANTALLSLTAPALRAQDAAWGSSIQAVRARFDPQETVIVTVNGQSTYRMAMFYLPEFPVLELGADGDPNAALLARDRHQQVIRMDSCSFAAPLEHAVWLLTSGDPPVGAIAVPMAQPRSWVWDLPLPTALAGYSGLSLPACTGFGAGTDTASDSTPRPQRGAAAPP